MKKILNKFLACLLILTTLFAVACKEEESSSTSSSSNGEIIEEEKPIVETDTYLVDLAGKSKYKIVIPTGSSKMLTVAADELQAFFKEATGNLLEIIYDSGLLYDENSYFLSIGETTIYKGSAVKVDYEKLGEDGLRLVTCGNTVIMVGGSDRGSMFAMYEFLERMFNFETYASDEYYIDKNVKGRKLKDFDITEIPSFARRAVGLFSFSDDGTFRNRMRQERYDEGWIYWSHSHFRILPLDKYWEKHKDWYYPKDAESAETVTQLCLSNEEMRAEFTRVLIELIKNNPEFNHIMLGQQDHDTFCDCVNCKAETSVYKNSGMMMRFINKVAADVQSYIDENEPGREFYLGTFSYLSTSEPPVNENNQPIDDSVRPAKNVLVLIAPIYACNSHPYDAPCNTEFKLQFDGWKNVASGHLLFWIYNKVFSQYFIPFNNFSTLVDNYKILQDLGAYFVYHQGNKETAAGGMEELKCYVEAKLMWNTNLNYDKLVSDFINNYYKDAAPYYREYYDLLRMSYAKWDSQGLHTYNNGVKALEIFDSKYWTQDLLDQFEELFQEMFKAIEKYKSTDVELYERLKLRIQKEHLTTRYLYMEFYLDKLPYEVAKEWINEFEQVCSRCGITVWKEMFYSADTKVLITSLVNKWRTNVSQK